MPATALFFDVGNTLLFPDRKRMLHALHEQQIFPSDDQGKEVERRTKRKFDSLLESHSAIDHGFWQIFYSHLLKDLQLSDDSLTQTWFRGLASRQTGVSAPESIYIGDVYSVDYLGATRFGMQAILFDVAGAYRESGLPRIESLEELESHLT